MNNDNNFRKINLQQIQELLKYRKQPSKEQLEQINRTSKSMNELLNSPAFKQAMKLANSPSSKAAMEAFTRLPIPSQQREISDLIKNTSKPTNSNLKRLSELIGIPGSKLTADQIERLNQLRSLEIPTKTDNEIYEGIQYPSLDSGDNDKNKTSDTGNIETDSINDGDWNSIISEAAHYATIYNNLDDDRHESKFTKGVDDISQQASPVNDVNRLLSYLWSVISFTGDTFETFKNFSEAIAYLYLILKALGLI